MKNIKNGFASFSALLEEIGHALAKTLRYGARAVATMSWPALMASCIVLALAITIVPLALFLFIVFVAVRLVVTAIEGHARRQAD